VIWKTTAPIPCTPRTVKTATRVVGATQRSENRVDPGRAEERDPAQIAGHPAIVLDGLRQRGVQQGGGVSVDISHHIDDDQRCLSRTNGVLDVA